MKKYGMTYIIDKKNQRVLLIRKLRPSFLANKLTAIGGNYEETDKTIKHCAIREIKEETNIDLNLEQLCFLEREIKSDEFDLTIFYCFVDADQIKKHKNMIDEVHDWYDLAHVLNREDLARNVKDHLSIIMNS